MDFCEWFDSATNFQTGNYFKFETIEHANVCGSSCSNLIFQPATANVSKTLWKLGGRVQNRRKRIHPFCFVNLNYGSGNRCCLVCKNASSVTVFLEQFCAIKPISVELSPFNKLLFLMLSIKDGIKTGSRFHSCSRS